MQLSCQVQHFSSPISSTDRSTRQQVHPLRSASAWSCWCTAARRSMRCSTLRSRCPAHSQVSTAAAHPKVHLGLAGAQQRSVACPTCDAAPSQHTPKHPPEGAPPEVCIRVLLAHGSQTLLPPLLPGLRALHKAYVSPPLAVQRVVVEAWGKGAVLRDRHHSRLSTDALPCKQASHACQ